MRQPLFRPLCMALALMGLIANTDVHAQSRAAVRPAAAAPGPLGGALSQGQGGPITIDADRLEVRDKEKKAVFTGNVVATRGESIVRSAQMIVFYSGNTPGAQPAASTPATPGAGQGNQQIRRIEMSGKVLFTQRDQNATSEAAVYEKDGDREILTMTGNVVLTQGQNVVTGPKLVVDLKTNQAQIEGGPGGRVKSIIVPNEASSVTAAPAQRPRR